MRISDWSSDVCSSDLAEAPHPDQCARVGGVAGTRVERRVALDEDVPGGDGSADGRDGDAREPDRAPAAPCRDREDGHQRVRSDERSGGEEWVSKCRSRWGPGDENKKHNNSTNE